MSVNIISRAKALAQDVAALFKAVEEQAAPKPDLTKRVPVEVSVALSFATGDFSVKTATFVNGGDDVWLQRLGYAVQMCRPLPSPAPAGKVPVDTILVPYPSGFYAAQTAVGFQAPVRLSSPSPLFDFRWNYQLASTQASYGSSANTVELLSRTSLGYPEAMEGMTFDPPGFLVRAGDTVTFYVQPSLYPLPGLDPLTVSWPYIGNTSFVVNLTAVGFRDGRMAEAAYER